MIYFPLGHPSRYHRHFDSLLCVPSVLARRRAVSEREIRDLLHRLCADIDRRARAVGRTVKKGAVPLALGAGLALSAGACSDDASPAYQAPFEAGVDSNKNADGPQPAYMAPPFEAGVDTTTPLTEAGPQPDYMAPDVGPQPDYMAPDAGPQPDYMAPDASS
jgi:hypothetical protein